MSEKTHWKKAFDSDYLGACDVEDGRDIIAIIKKVEIREIKGITGEKQSRNIALFTDVKIKPMVLNSTNCKIVKKFANSSFIEDWKNIPIRIYVMQVKAFGDITDGLRIREIQPTMAKIELVPTMAAWSKIIQWVKDGKGTIANICEKYKLSDENLVLLTDQTQL